MQPDLPARNPSTVARDMLAFLGLATVVALATAIALAAAVLLLAGRAEAAQSEPETLLLHSLDGRALPCVPSRRRSPA